MVVEGAFSEQGVLLPGDHSLLAGRGLASAGRLDLSPHLPPWAASDLYPWPHSLSHWAPPLSRCIWASLRSWFCICSPLYSFFSSFLFFLFLLLSELISSQNKPYACLACL